MGRDYRFSNRRSTDLAAPFTFSPSITATIDFRSPIYTNLLSSLRASAGLWDKDKAWSAKSKFADGRQSIICGGGGCNIPRCTFQTWSIDEECNERTMETVLCQMERYAQHQVVLQGLISASPVPVLTETSGSVIPKPEPIPVLGNPWYSAVQHMDNGRSLSAMGDEFNRLPDPKNSMSSQEKEALANRVHARMTQHFSGTGWGAWAKNVLSSVAAMRWSSNLRWYMAVDGNWNRTCPNEWAWLGNAEGNRTFFDFQYSNGEYPNPPPIQLSFKATSFDQMGSDRQYSPRTDPRGLKIMYPRSRDGGGADRNPPLIGNTNSMPVSKEDFCPEALFFKRNMGARKNPLAYIEGSEVHFTGPAVMGQLSSFWKLWPDQWGAEAFIGGFEKQIDRWVAEGQTIEGTRRFINGEWNGIPHPYYILGWVCSVAADSMNLPFLTATVQGMQGYARYYSKLPASLQTIKPSQLYEMVRAQQAAVDAERSAYVSGVLTAVGSTVGAIVASMSGTGPWGAVIGAIVAVISIVVGLFMAYAYEIGTARIENPPCPSPPFIRMIPASGETSACDFDAERIPGANSGVAIKAGVIDSLAQRGLGPGAWVTVLKSMERQGDETQTPPAPPEGPNLLLIGGAAVAALAVIGIAAVGMRK